MVLILYQRGYKETAKKVATDLVRAFSDHITVSLLSAETASSWPGAQSWDDLLIIIFDGKKFPDSGNKFIQTYIALRSESAILLPVAVNAISTKPPGGASGIKALKYDRIAKGPNGRLVNRVGGMLGLRLQGRDGKIFISYRTADGSAIARQLHAHLQGLGHRAYLDEAKEFDGEPAIRPGTPVQKEIDEALGDANLLLLVDTPSAPASIWIKHEVETADALLLPILPLYFRAKGDHDMGPRFPPLRALQRWVTLPMPQPKKNPLNANQLDGIVSEAESYLCQIFRRKCRVPFLVEREFVSHGFAWKVLDKRMLMFESSKGVSRRIQTKVLSHCSIFNPVYSPALKRFAAFLKNTARCNYSLFIYDGEILPEPILDDIVKTQSEPVIILHHQELATLIDSNFTTIAA